MHMFALALMSDYQYLLPEKAGDSMGEQADCLCTSKYEGVSLVCIGV